MQNEIETERLLLRPWRDSDRQPLYRLNSDPRVMEFFPATLTREETDAAVSRYQEHYARHGFTFFAAELRETGSLIGIIGIFHTPFETHFTPCVEIGWRIAYDHWNRGLTTEAARALIRYGFEELRLPQIVALTVPTNIRSRRVMEKLGMTHDAADDFDHPLIAEGHPLRRHVLYRARR